MRLQSSSIHIDYQAVFNALPGLNLIISPELTIIGASKSYLLAANCPPADLIGQHFSVLCRDENPAHQAAMIQKWEASFRQVLSQRQPHTMDPVRFDRPRLESAPGVPEETYWQLTNIPVLNAHNQVQYILHEAQDITRTYLADKKIKEKEELFHMVSMATNDAIWDWHLQDNTIRWNENLKTLFGYSETVSTLYSWKDYIHPEDRDRVFLSFRQVLEEGDRFWFNEYRFRCADGSYSPVMNRGYVLYGPEGRPERMVGSIQDMTWQKEAENKVQEHAEFFEFVTNSIPALIWTSNPEGKTDFRNDYYLRFIDPAVAEKGHFHWSEVLPPDQKEALAADWQAQIRAGQPFEREIRICAASGEFRWILARVHPQYNQQGRLIRWLGIASDIQEQKETQHQLQASMERFRFLAEAMPQKVWTATADGRVDYLNQQWVDYTGLSLEDLRGHGFARAFHPEDLAEALQTWGQAIATGTSFQMEHRLGQARGTYRWHLGRGLPMRNEAGAIVMWVGTNTDIHEQKIAQQGLLETNLKLQKINEDLDSFVYTASHDLKLPIINMGSIFGELMRSCEITDPDHAKLVSHFYKSLEQIQATISDLSDIAKVQKNIDHKQEEVDLQALTDEILLSIQDQVKASGARIVTDFAPVPTLFFSRVYLRSIFYNLISNAIKYQAPDRQPVVAISTYQQEDCLVLAVQDNGLGLNLETHRDKLFQMFRRFHNHVPGTGLGLYIINRIMQNNNGFVAVDSKLNVGSTFRIYFK